MTYQSFTASSALRRLAAALDRMTDDEISKLNDPNCEIEIKIVRRRVKEEASADGLDNLDAIVLQLSALRTRADAFQLIENSFANKKSLEQLAKRLDVSILKQDKIETLREKIVESTVGARLRSEAIKGTD